jgi:hypothetical protein
LTRLYRFLRNDRFDNWLLTEQLLRLLSCSDRLLLLALDWTKWQARFSLLTAAVCTGALSSHCRLGLPQAQPLALTEPLGGDFPPAGGGSVAGGRGLGRLALRPWLSSRRMAEEADGVGAGLCRPLAARRDAASAP